ncbi:MAG: AAA family ATPase, partial [Deltaproteobacteria bacterium]|nr:AAA family ATPase [Deltaproteobacteria bacterium]
MNEKPNLKELSDGIQSFRKIIKDNCLYADKTRYIYNLIRLQKPYFLSRPRRFGKSLLLDTMKEIFLGRRELFKGLWIDSSDYDWAPHPVIHLSFGSIRSSSVSSFENRLNTEL